MSDDEKQEMVVPGIEATREWMEKNQVSPTSFALKMGVDPHDFRKFLKKKFARVSVEMAFKIQRATNGAVPAEKFVPVKAAP